MSTVTSPKCSVSPPVTVMACLAGIPIEIAVSMVIGAPTTGACVCAATGTMSDI